MNAPRFLAALLLFGACTPAPPTLSDADRTAITAEVREASMDLQEALNAHDGDAIVAFYELDADFVYLGCTNYMFGGSLFGNIVRGYHRSNPDVTYDLAVQSVQVLGPGAAVVSLQGSGGNELDLFVTRALRRGDDGRWLITYEHESWPGCDNPRPAHPGTAPGDTLAVAPIGQGD